METVMDKKNLHHWDVLALSCIDGRFVKRVIDWTAEKTGGVFDYRTEVGCTKCIVDSEEDRDRLFELIKVSIRLHDIKEVWLIDHIDCGAYGGSGEFDNEEKEEAFHSEQLSKAADIIKARFPQLEVKKYFADWESVVELA